MDLLERETQLQQMKDTIQRVSDGESAIVLIGGEVGIGKISFVTPLATSLRLLGAVCRRALATPLERL